MIPYTIILCMAYSFNFLSSSFTHCETLFTWQHISLHVTSFIEATSPVLWVGYSSPDLMEMFDPRSSCWQCWGVRTLVWLWSGHLDMPIKGSSHKEAKYKTSGWDQEVSDSWFVVCYLHINPTHTQSLSLPGHTSWLNQWGSLAHSFFTCEPTKPEST